MVTKQSACLCANLMFTNFFFANMMQHGSGEVNDNKISCDSGIALLAANELFDHLLSQHERIEAKDVKAVVMISAIEFYNERVFDLLADQTDISLQNKNLSKTSKLKEVREYSSGNFQVQGQSWHIVKNKTETNALFKKAHFLRHKSATKSNKRSSRSHCIVTLRLEKSISTEVRYFISSLAGKIGSLIEHVFFLSVRLPRGVCTQSSGLRLIQGKLHFVDLAGSERLEGYYKKHSQKERAESAAINKSLAALNSVIASLLAQQKKHTENPSENANSSFIPYRNSKLTRILKTSLSDCKTLMIACIHWSKENLQETLLTLNFMKRVKQVKVNYSTSSKFRPFAMELDEPKQNLILSSVSCTENMCLQADKTELLTLAKREDSVQLVVDSTNNKTTSSQPNSMKNNKASASRESTSVNSDFWDEPDILSPKSEQIIKQFEANFRTLYIRQMKESWSLQKQLQQIGINEQFYICLKKKQNISASKVSN
ncbi:hypothetical protein RFI_00975 [Reticulomyxa filosa]|uniref:Kinesin-like protein n=1 Tax=Reticulomyxa filosa TaxID=46433 RepID=X6PC47_RETFI|nr:hypothetical protein RFI_00975 [Reticulomyxa filosa]|eukprot:ETO36090.1 hypothetical protein RFI_00975 [Reticulomyxa filosa]